MALPARLAPLALLRRCQELLQAMRKVDRMTDATEHRAQERLKWWRTDLAYKAPEQIDGRYVSALLEDLEKVSNLNSMSVERAIAEWVAETGADLQFSQRHFLAKHISARLNLGGNRGDNRDPDHRAGRLAIRKDAGSACPPKDEWVSALDHSLNVGEPSHEQLLALGNLLAWLKDNTDA